MDALVEDAPQQQTAWILVAFFSSVSNIHRSICNKYKFRRGWSLTEHGVDFQAHSMPQVRSIWPRYSKDFVEYFAGQGWLNCIQYVRDRGGSITGMFYAAAGGHLECLKYLADIGAQVDGADWAASKKGHLECLKFVHEHKGKR